MMHGGLLEDDLDDDDPVQQMLHPRPMLLGPSRGRRQEEFRDSPPDRRDFHYTGASYGAGSQDGGTYNPLKITRAPTRTKAKDWPWFEHAFKDFLACHQDYLRELEEVRDHGSLLG